MSLIFLLFTECEGGPVLVRADTVIRVRGFDPCGYDEDYAECRTEILQTAGRMVDSVYVREPVAEVIAAFAPVNMP